MRLWVVVGGGWVGTRPRYQIICLGGRGGDGAGGRHSTTCVAALLGPVPRQGTAVRGVGSAGVSAAPVQRTGHGHTFELDRRQGRIRLQNVADRPAPFGADVVACAETRGWPKRTRRVGQRHGATGISALLVLVGDCLLLTPPLPKGPEITAPKHRHTRNVGQNN